MTDRVALVTGAGSERGIGFAAARRLHALGLRLAITSTTDRIVQRAAELGPDVEAVVADLTDPAAAQRVARSCLERFGRIDVLVNNAGMTSVSDPDSPDSIGTISDEQWRASIARNLDTAMYVTRAIVGAMRAAGYGRIVTVASVSGPTMAFPDDVAYHASKAALVGLTRSIALDLAPHGITANAVAPGWIATGTSPEHELRYGAATPVGRPGTPEEIAAVIAFLAGEDASYLTGQVVVADGGNSIAEVRA